MQYILLIGAVTAVIGIVSKRWVWFLVSGAACLPMALYSLAVPSRLFNIQGILLLGLPAAAIAAIRLGIVRLSQVIAGLLAVSCATWFVVIMVDPW